MSDDQLSRVLGSMGRELGPGETEDALDGVHARSRQRRRHRTLVRSAIGAAAAALVLVVAVVAVDHLDRDDAQQVIADQPTDTTQPAWMVTTSLPDPSTPTSPPPQTPPPLQADQLDDIVGVELRTWIFDDQVDGFWSASPSQTSAIVQALRSGGQPFPRPEVIDHAYVRFELANGEYALLEMDVESGWIEPEGRLPDALTRQIRDELNDVVGHPWERVDRTDPDVHVQRVLRHTSQPWPSPDAALADILIAFERERHADYERWYGEVRREEGTVFVEIRWRGMGDDSGRGWDYRFWLEPTEDRFWVEPEGGRWELSATLERGLCLRSPSSWNEAAGTPSCL
jgi:hypothetical protein